MSARVGDTPVAGGRAGGAEALRRVVALHGEPPGGEGRARWTNLLLDEIGSDARPLARLLLRVHALGVTAQVPRAALAPDGWAALRARLALDYAAETYTDPTMARWAVHCWGRALGAAPVDAPAPAEPVPAEVAPSVPAPVAAMARPVVRTPYAAALPPPAVTRGRLKVPGRVRRAAARAHLAPVPNPFPANFDRIAAWAFGAIFVASAAAMWAGIVDRREAGALEVRRAGPSLVLAGAASVEPRPPAAAAPARAEPAPPAREPAAPSAGSALDSLLLRDGTVRTGRLRLITPYAIHLYDPWADSVVRVALGEVSEVRARGGAAVKVAPAEAPNADGGDPVAHGMTPIAARGLGLGGRFAVRHRVLGVDGSASCDAVGRAAAARGGASGADSLEVLTHDARAGTFTLASRPGVHGTVDDDGRFRSEVVTGTHDGVRWRFRMVGQFTDDGFVAETESETDAVLKWGTLQRCRVSALLVARRVR